MDDLIKKLRTPEIGWPGDAECIDGDVAAQAADEIERLRAALSETTAERDAARTALQASIRIAGTARARAIYDEQKVTDADPA